MMTTEIDISRKRNDTKRATFIIRDEDGTVVDISGWTNFLLTLNTEKVPTDNTNQIAQLTGAFSTDGTDGRVYFVPDGSVAVGVYFYDVQALDSNSEKCTIVEGQFSVGQDITKD